MLGNQDLDTAMYKADLAWTTTGILSVVYLNVILKP